MKICNQTNCKHAGIEQEETEFHWKSYGVKRVNVCRTCASEKKKKVAAKPRKIPKMSNEEEAQLYNQLRGRWG